MMLDAGRLEVRTSSCMARAICVQVSLRGWSSRTKDHCRIVTGPVSMPFIGSLGQGLGRCHQRTVIGLGRETSPKRIGGFTQRLP